MPHFIEACHHLTFRAESILVSIDYNPLKHTTDLLDSLRTGAEIVTRAQARAAWILGSGDVDRWLLGLQSDTMAVNSNEVSSEHQSAVSVFSAMLVKALIKRSDDVVVYWACCRNIHSGPIDIVRDIIGQLLQKGDSNLACVALPSCTTFNSRDFVGVLNLLVALLTAQLAKRQVLMIIDSISCYEDSARSPDTRTLFRELYSLVDNLDTSFPLKVLVTSPTQCTYLGTFLDDSQPTLLR